MQYVPFENGITVSGRTVNAIADALKSVKVVTSTLLEDLQTRSRDKDGNPVIEPDAWYPLEQYLQAFKKIDTLLGGRGLERVGNLINRNAAFPPDMHDVPSALKALDFAYHLNHAKGGQPMFDPATGRRLEGIGRYGYEPVAGERKVICVCENPYPCRFDLGILVALAQRFDPGATVTHDASAPCRQKGADSCTFVVTW